MNHAKNKSQGFTIVELLVVIAVIAILAAITIVSYTGVTNKANGAKVQSNANSVAKVASAYAGDTGGFATAATLAAWSGVSKIPSDITLTAATTSAYPTSSSSTSTIYYLNKGTTGACIGYYNPGTAAIEYMKLGNAATASFTSSAATCS